MVSLSMLFFVCRICITSCPCIVILSLWSYALMTHLFLCLQVVYTPGQQDKCFLCGQVGHLAANCEGKVKRKAGEFDEKGDAIVPKKPYQVIMTYIVCCNRWFHKTSRWIQWIPLCLFCAFAVLEYMDPSGVLRIRVQNAKPTFQNWFWTHRWWFHLHVLLCWQWFSSTYANARDPWGLFPVCLTEHPSLYLVPFKFMLLLHQIFFFCSTFRKFVSCL